MDVPLWDLSDLYKSIEDASIARDRAAIEKDVEQFKKEHSSQDLNNYSASKLLQAIQDYESIIERSGKIGSYASLLFTTRMNDQNVLSFYQSIQDFYTKLDSDILFFTLNLNNIRLDVLDSLLAQSVTLSVYRPWLMDIRAFKPYQLSEELEKLLVEKSATSRLAWVRLFDESLNSLRFDWSEDQKTVQKTLGEMLHYLTSSNAVWRKAAGLELGRVFTQNARLFGTITNVLAKDKSIDDQWRGFKHPSSSRNLANLVEDEVVDALCDAVKGSYENLSHRFYKMKAKWLGVEKIPFWDRLAPAPFGHDHSISWETAKKIVLDAYHEFSPQMASIAKTFFDNNWIDAKPYEGKDSGAYMNGVVKSHHPYVFMNYHGTLSDVKTLAHELGHAVHYVLASKQAQLNYETPLTIAETASVFGEMLTFRSLLSQEKDPIQKKAIIANKVDQMLSTVVRQIAFFEFEKKIHNARKKGDLSLDEIRSIWLDTMQESLGDAIDLSETYQDYWLYVSHFIHAPFYVYAYAFGDCLVNSLYAKYQASHEGFVDKYLDLLSAGGSKRYNELLKPFDLDAKDPKFWQMGLSVIEDLIDQLEELDDNA